MTRCNAYLCLLLAACSAPSDGAPVSAPAGADPRGAPGLALGALDAVPRTIPYGGYVDFDGEPVNAGAVGFNFVIFPCATPGTGAVGCDAVWVAKGAWTNAEDWTTGWPTGATSELDLPIFSGRFAVELGGAGQNPLPDAVFDTGGEPLYLGVRVEGRALGALQKIVPTTRTHTAALAESARVADMVGDLTPEEIATRRSWATSGEVAPGGTLELQTFGDATDAEVFVWERRGATWVAIDPTKRLRDDPMLFAWYPFDDAAAPGRDASKPAGQGKDLTLQEAATYDATTAVRGASLDFNGGFATITNLGLTPGTGVTMTGWMRPRASHGTHLWTLSPAGSNYFMLVQFTEPNCGLPARVRLYGDYISANFAMCSNGQLAANTWMHVAVVYDNVKKTQLVYFDGVLDNRAGGNISFPATLNYLRLGGWFGGHGEDYWGHMDDFVIFNRALGPDEVATLHRYGLDAPYEVTTSADGTVTVKNRSTTAQALRLLVVK